MQVNSGSETVALYFYDALNRRIRKAVGGATTDFIYSGWQCVEERNPFGGGSTDTATMQYVWGIYLDELLQQLPRGDQRVSGELAALSVARSALPHDRPGRLIRGRPRGMELDAYGNTLIFRTDTAHAVAITFTNSDGQVSVPTCPFIFTGQRFDYETGEYFCKGRYYSPALGRFLSKDPAGYGRSQFLRVRWRLPTRLRRPVWAATGGAGVRN